MLAMPMLNNLRNLKLHPCLQGLAQLIFRRILLLLGKQAIKVTSHQTRAASNPKMVKLSRKT